MRPNAASAFSVQFSIEIHFQPSREGVQFRSSICKLLDHPFSAMQRAFPLEFSNLPLSAFHVRNYDCVRACLCVCVCVCLMGVASVSSRPLPGHKRFRPKRRQNDCCLNTVAHKIRKKSESTFVPVSGSSNSKTHI